MKKTFKQKWALKIRKAHRYLGIFLGIQFIFWTLSGLYFSWRDINELRVEHLKKIRTKEKITKLISPTKIDNHHEHRNKHLPVYAITYNSGDNIKAYVSAIDPSFQDVRKRSWNRFDFLWMTHAMDYKVRDNFNISILKLFPLLILITVLSGFLLWFVSSKTLKK